jgi:hypothetical protein
LEEYAVVRVDDGRFATMKLEGGTMWRAAKALGMATLVGLTVSTAAYFVARGADPLVQALTTGAAAFVAVMARYFFLSDHG